MASSDTHDGSGHLDFAEHPPTLRELSLAKVVDAALASDPSEISRFESAHQLDEFHEAVLAKLTQQPELIHSPCGIELLSRACSARGLADLGVLKGLTASMVADIVERSTKSDPANAVVLTLPSQGALPMEGIHRMLDRGLLSGLHTSGELLDIVHFASHPRLDEFSSPELFSRPFKIVNAHEKEQMRREDGKLLGYGQPPDPAYEGFPNGDGTRYPVAHLLYATYRNESGTAQHGDPWTWVSEKRNDGEGPHVFAFPLRDALLTTSELVEYIPSALPGLILPNMWTYQYAWISLGGIGRGLASYKALSVRMQHQRS